MKRTATVVLMVLGVVACSDDAKPVVTTPPTDAASSETIVTEVPSTKLSTGMDDFARLVERFIEGTMVEAKTGGPLKDAECTSPASTAHGERLLCLARGASDESSYRYTVTITGPQTFKVTSVEVVTSA